MNRKDRELLSDLILDNPLKDFFNQQVLTLHEVIDDEVKDGATFRELIRHLEAARTLGETLDEEGDEDEEDEEDEETENEEE